MDNSAKTLETIKSNDSSRETNTTKTCESVEADYDVDPVGLLLSYILVLSLRDLWRQDVCISIMYAVDEWSSVPRRIKYTTLYQRRGQICSEMRGSDEYEVTCHEKELICSFRLSSPSQTWCYSLPWLSGPSSHRLSTQKIWDRQEREQRRRVLRYVTEHLVTGSYVH